MSQESLAESQLLKMSLSLCSADTIPGYGPLIREYVFFLLAKLAFHRQHPEFNGRRFTDQCHLPYADAPKGLFEYEEYVSLKSINDASEG